MSIPAIFASISTVEKIVPVIEAVCKEIGPVVQIEVTDGKAVWADVEKALADLKAALATIRTAIASRS